MRAEDFVRIIGADFYTGVPDSQLKALCNYLIHTYGTDPQHHIIAANEGNCAALAAGYHLATGKVPVVYMQNSGEGNIINPAASLLHPQVYAIPVLFVIGWRGEPGVHDEPQHIFQGAVTIRLLSDMEIASFVLSPETTEDELVAVMTNFRRLFAAGKQAAIVVQKGALTYDQPVRYENSSTMLREEVIRHVIQFSGEDPVISTTGKASRELFELRAAYGQSHQYDFLTVGSMGHASSAALGLALSRPALRFWCIDGDGAVLMHMGSLAVTAQYHPENLIHVVVNNGSHESVGGMPTAAPGLRIAEIAKACGYPYTVCVGTLDALDHALAEARDMHTLSLIEAKCAIGARPDLGRPTATALENKQNFMSYLK